MSVLVLELEMAVAYLGTSCDRHSCLLSHVTG
jgi:hypothetical protein